MPWWRSVAYRYPWRGMSRWGRRRWRPTADSATLAHALHKKRVRARSARIFRNMGFNVYPSAVIAPLIAGGSLLKPPGENEVYVKGDYADPEAIGFTNSFLPYVVNTPVGWNVTVSEIQMYPLWWTRMR